MKYHYKTAMIGAGGRGLTTQAMDDTLNLHGSDGYQPVHFMTNPNGTLYIIFQKVIE